MATGDPNTLSFFEHLEELRQVLLKCLLLMGFFTLLALCFHSHIFSFFQNRFHASVKAEGLHIYKVQEVHIQNLSSNLKTYRPPQPQHIQKAWLNQEVIAIGPEMQLPPGSHLTYHKQQNYPSLQIISPFEGLLSLFKLGILSGVAFSFPFCLYWLFGFISPAIDKKTQRLLGPLFILSCLNLVLGLYLGSHYALPVAIETFEAFNVSLGENQWTLSSFLDLGIYILLGSVLFLQILLSMFTLAHLRILNAKKMAEGRKFFMVLAFILGAIFTPPDVLSQIAFALPLIVYYELCYGYCLLREKATHLSFISASS